MRKYVGPQSTVQEKAYRSMTIGSYPIPCTISRVGSLHRDSKRYIKTRNRRFRNDCIRDDLQSAWIGDVPSCEALVSRVRPHVVRVHVCGFLVSWLVGRELVSMVMVPLLLRVQLPC